MGGKRQNIQYSLALDLTGRGESPLGGHQGTEPPVAKPDPESPALAEPLLRLNLGEPPWYGPVCPVVWEGRHREVPPYPDQCAMRRLAGLAEDAEHVCSFERVNREPVEPLPPRPAVAAAAFPGELARACQWRSPTARQNGDGLSDSTVVRDRWVRGCANSCTVALTQTGTGPVPRCCQAATCRTQRVRGSAALPQGSSSRYGGPGHSTSPTGAWTARSCSRGTTRESRIVISWLSLPPERLTATSMPSRIIARHSTGTAMPGGGGRVHRGSCLGTVLVGDRHGRGDADEEGPDHVFGHSAFSGRRALIDGDDGGTRGSVDEELEVREVAVLSAGRGLKVAAMNRG